MKKLHFTLDLEEWYDAENVKPHVDAREVKHSSMYVIHQLLTFLADRKIRGTFFCLGKTASENGHLIKEIAQQGHEIASHGWSHTLLESLTEKETLQELRDTKSLLEDLSGTPVVGFRSPCFSQNSYVYNCLEATGHKYTSMKISASYHDRYRSDTEYESPLLDFPLPVATIGNLSFPATGGGWFRLFPIFLQAFLLTRISAEHAIFYCHPWDFDSNQPSFNGPASMKFRHSVNVGNAFKKLGKLSFDQRSLGELLKSRD